MPVLPDLITPDRAASALSAAVGDLTHLGSWVSAASAAVRRHTGLVWTRAVFDEIYAGSEGARLVLRNVPVNEVLRASGGPQAVLKVMNLDASNQIATVKLTFT